MISITDQLDAYMRMPVLQRSTNPLEFWKNEQEKLPILAKLAMKSSSVYSERMFSEMGNINDERRNRLLPQNFEKLLLLHHNLVKFT